MLNYKLYGKDGNLDPVLLFESNNRTDICFQLNQYKMIFESSYKFYIQETDLVTDYITIFS